MPARTALTGPTFPKRTCGTAVPRDRGVRSRLVSGAAPTSRHAGKGPNPEMRFGPLPLFQTAPTTRISDRRK